MSLNEIAVLIVTTALLMLVPPSLYAENKFGNDIRRWLPNQGERERFILSGMFAFTLMTIIATITFYFESARSVSAVLFLSAVITLGITLAVAQADKNHILHLIAYWVYTFFYFLAGVALLYSYSFDFNVDTPWALTAILSSLIVGIFAGKILTETDTEEKGTLVNALLAFIALCLLVIGIYLMTVNVAAGLLMVGIIVFIAGIVKSTMKSLHEVLFTAFQWSPILFYIMGAILILLFLFGGAQTLIAGLGIYALAMGFLLTFIMIAIGGGKDRSSMFVSFACTVICVWLGTVTILL